MLLAFAIVLFAIIMSLNGFVFGVISMQLVPLLEAAGLATAAAVWVASMKGVEQLDLLDEGHSLVLSRSDSGSLNLEAVALP